MPDFTFSGKKNSSFINGKLMLTQQIVAIGGSAGSSEVLKTIFNLTPIDNATYIILRHLPKHYKSMLNMILKKHSKLQVVEAAQGMPLENNKVYYAPPDFYLTIINDAFELVPRQEHVPNKAIDLFLLSLAQSEAVRKSVAVILSGTGKDGVQGAEAVKKAGGMVIAQAPDSCSFPTLPQQVINKGLADFILMPEDMPPVIQGSANLTTYTGS